MRRIALMLAALLTPCAAAAHDRAGDFDYYVLALSWSPSWCAAEGAGRDEPQCDPASRRGFVVHGLWPQNERGWPSDCRTDAPDPSRRDSAGMTDVMGSAGIAWYQWKKHGRCSGLSGRDYYAAIRKAAAVAAAPALFRALPRDIRIPATVVEDAFISEHRDMQRDGITVTCDAGRLDEVRICLTRDLQPRACAPDTRRDCRGPMLMEAPG